MKSLAEVVQPDGSTRWELIELREQFDTPEVVVEEKPVKRTRKSTPAPVELEPTETFEF